jgi:hypothetical protein
MTSETQQCGCVRHWSEYDGAFGPTSYDFWTEHCTYHGGSLPCIMVPDNKLEEARRALHEAQMEVSRAEETLRKKQEALAEAQHDFRFQEHLARQRAEHLKKTQDSNSKSLK